MKREYKFDFQEDAMQFWLGPFMPGVLLYHPDACRAVLSKSGKSNATSLLRQVYLPHITDKCVPQGAKPAKKNPFYTSKKDVVYRAKLFQELVYAVTKCSFIIMLF